MLHLVDQSDLAKKLTLPINTAFYISFDKHNQLN